MTSTRPRRSFGQIKRKDSGRYAASFVPPDDPTGRRVNAPATFSTKREAERWLASVEVDLRRGDWRPTPSRVTLAEYGTQFLADHSGAIAPATRTSYTRNWRRRIEPHLGSLPLREIKPSHVRAWISTLSRSGLSPASVRQAFRLLNQLLTAAVGDEHLTANPALAARKALPRLPEPTPHILTPEEVEAMRAAMKPGRDRLMFDLLTWTGLRIGELFGLRRRSVDVLHRRLIVAEAVVEDGGDLLVTDTKTHQTRRVTLPAFLVADLVAHLDAEVARRADALLFPSRTGAPMRYGSYRRWVWDPAAVEAGLAVARPQPPATTETALVIGKPGPKPKPRLRDLWTVTVSPHALRATHATLVASQHGIFAAAERLGHSNASITSLHYARVQPGTEDKVADWLDTLRPAATTTTASRP